jgi:hypothetical protein
LARSAPRRPPRGSHDRPVEVQGPLFVGDVRSRGLDLRPLGDKVGRGLRLDGSAGDVFDVVAHELAFPFGHSSHSVAAVDDLPEGE